MPSDKAKVLVRDVFITLAELKARPLPKDDRDDVAVPIDPITGERKVLGVARPIIHELDEGRRFGMSMDIDLDDPPDRSDRAAHIVYKRILKLRNEFKLMYGKLDIFDVPIRPNHDETAEISMSMSRTRTILNAVL